MSAVAECGKAVDNVAAERPGSAKFVDNPLGSTRVEAVE